VDGVLLIEKPKDANTHFFMRIFNSDGSEAEACGNGYRCIGLVAHKELDFPKFMTVGTLAGPVTIDVQSDKAIKVKMVNPVDYREKVEIKLKNRSLNGAFINTGVPHVVIFVEGLDKVDELNGFPVEALGRGVRYHEHFKPKGTNVNFVQVTGDKQLSIRTYERGVEGETLACGTGSVAAAIIANLQGKVEAPVEVAPKSGEKLKIYFERSGKKVTNVFLEGPAKIG
jgi:diaminopimelate epimerase